MSWRMPVLSRSKACLRPTNTNCTRNSSSNAKRSRARSLSTMLSGKWMMFSAACRSIIFSRSRICGGSGSLIVRGAARSSALRTQLASSHVDRFAFSLCGYIGTIRPVLSPMMSTTGLTICILPRNSSGLPNTATSKSVLSCRSRHGWLKNVSDSEPVASPTNAVTMLRFVRSGTRRALRTFTSTNVSTPSTKSPTWASLVRST